MKMGVHNEGGCQSSSVKVACTLLEGILNLGDFIYFVL